MNLTLMKTCMACKTQITAMLDAWFAEESPDEITPWAITRLDYHDFENYCKNLDALEDPIKETLIK